MKRKKKSQQEDTSETQEKEIDWKKKRRHDTPRHTLVLEADVPEYVAERIFRMNDKLRIAGNVLVYEMNKRVRLMRETREYRMYWSIYRREAMKLAELMPDTPEFKAQELIRQHEFKPIQKMMNDYGVTIEEAYRIINEAAEGMNLNTVFLQSRAEDIVDGVSRVLFGDGKELHQLKKGELPAIKSKQEGSAILIKAKDGQLEVGMKLPANYSTISKKFNRNVSREDRRRETLNRENAEKKNGAPVLAPMSETERNELMHQMKLEVKEMFRFGLKIKDGDRFAEEEVQRIISYLKTPGMEDKAVWYYKEKGILLELYRPCCASIVCETIRGRKRVFVHITVEGKPAPKYDKNGNPRHTYGEGAMGVDLGPQSVASVTFQDARLENLAERDHRSTRLSEKKEKQIQRYMDRSRRAMNPQYYNANGTIKKGRKRWKESGRYKAARDCLHTLRRRNAESRHYAINEMVHLMRARAGVVYIEPKNVKSMMKRAKPENKDKDKKKSSAGSPGPKSISTPATDQNRALSPGTKPVPHKRKSRKRHGKSVLNRCPGYFFDTLKQVFESTGGKFLIVPKNYRASQYDHTADAYIKKTLNDRMFLLSDGTLVQRDMYSGYLLLCPKSDLSAPDRKTCEDHFRDFLIHQEACISEIKANHWNICNSGIKFPETKPSRKAAA